MKKIILLVLVFLSLEVFSQTDEVILEPQQMKEDIEVFTTQKDIKEGTDPQIEAALKLIGNY